MLLWMDREACISCGTCHEACGALFEFNPEDGRTQVTPAYSDRNTASAGYVPAEFEEGAAQAEEACPIGIIHTSG